MSPFPLRHLPLPLCLTSSSLLLLQFTLGNTVHRRVLIILQIQPPNSPLHIPPLPSVPYTLILSYSKVNLSSPPLSRALYIPCLPSSFAPASIATRDFYTYSFLFQVIFTFPNTFHHPGLPLHHLPLPFLGFALIPTNKPPKSSPQERDGELRLRGL